MRSRMIGWKKTLPAPHKLMGSLMLCLLLAACSQARHEVVALEPTSETASATDGMILKEYPGPKAQIHYAQGEPAFFCDLIDLFSVLLEPEQKRPIAAVFVQDMGKTSWDQPAGNWIDARSALYVVGSKKLGAMGATFGSFSSMRDAEQFVKTEGGKILRFEQITPAIVSRDDGICRTRNA